MTIPRNTHGPDVRGHIKTGVIENGRPKALGHFASDDPEFHAVKGDTPTRLYITFDSAVPGEVFPTAMESWANEGIFCRCTDGETAKYKDDGRPASTPCVPFECGRFTASKCTPVGRLYFSIHGMDGLWLLTTRSFYSIIAMEDILGENTPNAWGWALDVSQAVKGGNKVHQLSLTPVKALETKENEE